MTPELTSAPGWKSLLQDKEFVGKSSEARKVCAQSIPFLGASLQGDEYFETGAYLGMRETGLFCNTPLLVNEFFHSAMDSNPEYSCPASEFPYEYEGWNPKWYSHFCRGWYKEQESKPS